MFLLWDVGKRNVEGKRTHDAKPSRDPTDGFIRLCRAAAAWVSGAADGQLALQGQDEAI